MFFVQKKCMKVYFIIKEQNMYFCSQAKSGE